MIYYIDVSEGNAISRDEDGIEFCSLDDACRAVAALLSEIARDAMHGRRGAKATMLAGGKQLMAEIRNEGNQVVFRTTLRLDMEFHMAETQVRCRKTTHLNIGDQTERKAFAARVGVSEERS
jgi:hypothetical protein